MQQKYGNEKPLDPAKPPKRLTPAERRRWAREIKWRATMDAGKIFFELAATVNQTRLNLIARHRKRIDVRKALTNGDSELCCTGGAEG
jgi:hypothetical protein